MSTINYSEKIPNNVNLGEDRTLQRALGALAAHLHQLVGRRGPRGLDQPRGLPAHGRERGPVRAGPSSAT